MHKACIDQATRELWPSDNRIDNNLSVFDSIGAILFGMLVFVVKQGGWLVSVWCCVVVKLFRLPGPACPALPRLDRSRQHLNTTTKYELVLPTPMNCSFTA